MRIRFRQEVYQIFVIIILMSKLKIAIVHDAFVTKGGAERLAYYISKVFPDAPIFTSVHIKNLCFEELTTKNIHTHYLSNFIKNERQFKFLYPIWLIFMLNSKFDNFDIVLSSSSYLAKFISSPKSGKHICYLHNPFRFIWNRSSYTDDSLPYNSFLLKIIEKFLPNIQKFDFRYTSRIDHIITNSINMKNSINYIYNKDALVIHPPVEVNKYYLSDPQDYYLSVGRLISHKRLELVINACNRLNRKLIIIGDGPERKNLESISKPNIKFLGYVDNETLKKYYSTCKALIFPSNEDFGMVPIEVHASGRPVIAYESGGALETVKNEINGVFFKKQTVEDIENAIIQFEKMNFSQEIILNSVKRFDFSIFREKYQNLVNQVNKN